MTLKTDIEKIYSILIKLIFAIGFYLPIQYIQNANSEIIFLLMSVGLFGMSLLETLIYHFSKKKGFYSKYKIPILFILFALIIAVIFVILYLQQGGITDLFWYTFIPAIVAYIVALITVVSKSK